MKANAVNKTDRHNVVGQIRRQVERLVMPNLNGLRAVLLERVAALRAEDSRLAQEQDAVSVEGFAAAVRLLTPDSVVQSPEESAPAHYLALPNHRSGGFS